MDVDCKHRNQHRDNQRNAYKHNVKPNDQLNSTNYLNKRHCPCGKRGTRCANMLKQQSKLARTAAQFCNAVKQESKAYNEPEWQQRPSTWHIEFRERLPTNHFFFSPCFERNSRINAEISS